MNFELSPDTIKQFVWILNNFKESIDEIVDYGEANPTHYMSFRDDTPIIKNR
jgi:hypothetical protein